MSILFNQTNIAPGLSFASTIGGGGGGSGSNFPSGLTAGVVGTGGTTMGISTINQTWTTTLSNIQWNAHDINFLPASNSQGGSVFQRITYDPADAGQTALWMGVHSPIGSVIWSIWDGYIWMPLEIRGAEINMVSGQGDETYMYMNGNTNTISTGLMTFISGSNTLARITDPTGAYTADTTALFSTLSNLYPSNFL